MADISTSLTETMAATFSLFPDLPAELRRKIWAAAIDRPRLIHPQEPRVDFPCEPPKPSYHCNPPLLLQICKESRKEALLRYDHVPLPGGSYLGPPIYLNPLVDILYLSHATSTPPHHGVLGQFSLFSPLSLHSPPPRGRPLAAASPPATPWHDLRAIALCASGAQRLLEPLCLRFPELERVYLVQAPEKMQDAHLLKRRTESHLERRREARGDIGIPQGLVVEVVTWEWLRGAAGEWDAERRE